MSKHLSRIAVPKTWVTKKKGRKWITKPKPGMHSIKLGMPLNILLRDILRYAKNSKEVKKIINNQEILVDGKRRKDPCFIIGFMDVLSIPKIKEYYRIVINKKGNLIPLKIEEKESKIKLCKIKNKTKVKKKIQLNLSDGRNLLVDKTDNKVGDTIIIEIPSQKIISSLKLEKKAVIYLFSGKHTGNMGAVEDIKGNKLIIKTENNELIETLKEYAFVIGKDKPTIKLVENGR